MVATGFDGAKTVEDPFRKLSRVSIADMKRSEDRYANRDESRNVRDVREIKNIREETPVVTQTTFELPQHEDVHVAESDISKARNEMTLPTRKFETKMIIEEKIQPHVSPICDEAKSGFEEDDDLEIPAFIRRKMKK